MKVEIELPERDAQIVFLVRHPAFNDRYYIGGVWGHWPTREETVGDDWIGKEHERYDFVIVKR